MPHRKLKPQPTLSHELKQWLKAENDKTLAAFNDVFAEKSFAITFLLLLALPALPIPTGGVTHVTELIAMLLSLELIIGRKTIWLPKRWLKTDMGKVMQGKAAQKLIGVITWFERLSRRRWSGFLVLRPVVSVTALLILIFTVAAFVAPPFSGLDTLPALGVVVMSLGIILEDALVVFAGILIGSGGIAVEIAAGTALYSGLTHFF